jgi:PTH1 family peptidyl-tRNA hydrolase
MQHTIVGLGNPGEEYAHSRHNSGRMVVERFRKQFGFPEWEFNKKLNALVSKGELDGKQVVLVCPETFMNKSGAAVKPIVGDPKAAEKLIVVYDELDLPLGTLKLSFGRGSAGHKGLESVIRAIKTKDFNRIRVGVSASTPTGKLRKPTGDTQVDYIIAPFSKRDREKVEPVLAQAVEALATIIREGREQAMNRFN